jgi:hypothetical protein
MANHSIPADQRRKPRSLSLSDVEYSRTQAAARRAGKKWVKFMRDALATACERAEAAPAVEAPK